MQKSSKTVKSTRKGKSGGKIVLKSWVESFQFGKELNKKNPTGYVYFLGVNDANKYASLISEHGLNWQTDALVKSEKEQIHFVGNRGPVWIIRPRTQEARAQHGGLLEESDYTQARDLFGSMVAHFRVHQLQSVNIEFHGTEHRQELGALTGLEMASYQFRNIFENKESAELPSVGLKKSLGTFDKKVLVQARLRAKAVNLARHLVNLPPSDLNPKTFADLASKGLALPRTMKVAVWDAKRLEKEGMGLHLAVGQGSATPPCMVHLRYRPTKKSKKKPLAFVGKGITFDTGGLDIKPSSGMRLMKKDMGGAASILALAMWVAESGYERSCDFYLALAENSVDAKSFRPSDVCVARNGLRVEIDNTDAEGRLVLADSLDVAVTQKGADEPELVINVATLTGAIKVGLGAEIAGLFSNDDELAMMLTRAGQRAGDLNWRMPLFEKYFGSMSSPFADFKNSGEGFGGAITAALFLQKFVKGKKWAHLDVYAWSDRAHGALTPGGSGQPVQCLIDFLETQI